MLRKVYTLTTDNYDYFATCGGARSFKNGYRRTKFYNILEASKALKDSKTHDYDYGDSYQRTIGLTLSFEYVPDAQRWHARSKYEWEKIQKRNQNRNSCDNTAIFLDAEEIAYLLSFADEIDEDVLI